MGGKRGDVAKLPRDWREKLVSSVLQSRAGDSFKAAVSVLRATGCRPEELANGVQLAMINGQLAIRIKGAKVGLITANGKTHDRGIPTRVLVFDPQANEAVTHLVEQLKKSGQDFMTVSFNKDSLRVMVGRAADRVFPRIKTDISPYTFRHAMSSDLKSCDELTDQQRASCLGHLSVESMSSYGRRRRGGGGVSPIKSVQVNRQPRGLRSAPPASSKAVSLRALGAKAGRSSGPSFG